MQVLGIDITFEDMMLGQLSDDYYGLSSSMTNLGIQCIDYVKTLQKQLSDLRPIVLVLKKLLDNRSLNSPFHGGLSSYSLVLMVSAFLKNYQASGANSAAMNLFEFLSFYGFYFNAQCYCINGE